MDEQSTKASREAEAPRRRGRRRWLIAVGSVLAVAIVVVAVSQGGGGGGSPLNAIAKAAEVTQREPGGRAVFRATIDSATTSEGVTEDGSMVFDDSGRTRSVIKVKGHSTGREGTLVGISEGAKSFLRSDLFESLPEGKRWMEIDLTSAVKGASGSTAAPGTSPVEGLRILEKVIGAEKIGTEDIDGVPTTRYHGTLPTAEEVFGVKPDISESNIEVWIDSHERIRKMQIKITGGVKEAPDSIATTEMTIDFVEFGRVPKIVLPPQSEVDDVTGELERSVQSAAEGG